MTLNYEIYRLSDVRGLQGPGGGGAGATPPPQPTYWKSLHSTTKFHFALPSNFSQFRDGNFKYTYTTWAGKQLMYFVFLSPGKLVQK